MSLPNDASEDRMQMMTKTERFSKLFDELERCREDEQMQKMEEMNGLIDEMNEEELKSIFTIELFDKIHQIIEEKTLPLENALVLLKHVGYYRELKIIYLESFDYSLLRERMKEMIIDENEKKEEINEKILTDLCECYALLGEDDIFGEVLSIIVPCLLKVALKKDETEEAQKEVEMALLALGNIGYWVEKESYGNEIKEIIKYHQEHQNLTRLAYQSAWEFLIKRFHNYESLEEVFVNDLHFAREARREIEELKRDVDWKRKEETGKEAKELLIFRKWIYNIDNYFTSCKLWNEEVEKLLSSFVQMIREFRDNSKKVSNWCFFSITNAAENRNVKIDDLLKSGAVDAFSEEMKQSTLEDKIVYDCLYFFLNVSRRLNEKKDDEKKEAKRKSIKRKMFEWIEEGYEDVMTSFHAILPDLAEKSKFLQLSKYSSDYLWSL
ncbi:uncharacterized protein MONOS_9562 [Monocercomonoides exilis]|uniref:uncharacterized protein n=1 Tax=Monocercomonoides exilis TaxID=2049356 RepID=UPI0035597D82|nr:hypothetical protein MONOS_9562 [Monocercomonoides exilis]|eukprot:MONOS_9562.1-p1 / transcript=MONOS_9562.1 / gene=MONOS_9562 / organism=Monocercomonoides_exilis_PA203 / gene_product=unspecified product / transcript_product=unspecified product / location=Mono_scaffold00399:38397-39846(-) / protein_length=439 / sequence_SO=supercontig / SO=protein_coding / is_pseudo=false